MRRLVLFLAGALCLLGLAGCSSRVLNLDELGALAEEKGYTEADILEELDGQCQDSLTEAWGEPDGMLSEFWGIYGISARGTGGASWSIMTGMGWWNM
ncbi:MAG: hypothetical protein HFJ86_02890 [Oscillospiraceae bacterium]|jgi:hypothetical protein|nr:hypothetical protein [Oscillospiraceae bacterium]